MSNRERGHFLQGFLLPCLLVIFLLVFIAACSDSGDGVLYNGDLPSAPEASTPAPEPSPGNIVEV
ncbi:MAG: hypothetical protein ACPHRF_04275, partial [Porticoccaceae bacterium]